MNFICNSICNRDEKGKCNRPVKRQFRRFAERNIQKIKQQKKYADMGAFAEEKF